ncbi:hypothetical protein Patl1_19238 [Pistacia atlantica]|uniref:Uncharacterized protein n=1 Tax=Pistacia atlantica TaxID=434234 RepID=A0ACC1BZT1_9ROSI|nr:hypothetical protein Patl1_19238 [Pistacia atlantica]
MSSLPTGWEINVIFNFFVFDQLQDKYFTIQDGKIRRFHSMKTEWGISKILDLETFCNPSNGHLINDTCVLGEEIVAENHQIYGLAASPGCVMANCGVVGRDHAADLTNCKVTSGGYVVDPGIMAGQVTTWRGFG